MVENQNWKNNFQEAFKNSSELLRFLQWQDSSWGEVEKSYPIFVPKRLAEKIKTLGPGSVLAWEFLPDVREIDPAINFDGLEDPIGDKAHYKAPQLIHRYSTRALFTPTSICPVHCRYCFRKNELNPSEELFAADFTKTLEYLNNHPEISEIIFTGGDPFTLSNEKIEKYLNAFAEISSIRDIRFHSRYPVILPERFDHDLKFILQNASKKFRTVSLAVHANHAVEFDDVAVKKLQELAALDIQLLSQTVLLKDVNDNVQALLDLMNLFINIKVRPYYLHHPDQVKGGLHFYLPLERGRRLYGQLRDKLPGWAIPHYVIDIPGGHGKVTAFNPETHTFNGQLLGLSGKKFSSQEPDFFSF